MPRGTVIAGTPTMPPAASARVHFKPALGNHPARVAWWLWPHLLSLDAPLVAVVWHRWWTHAAGLGTPWTRDVILGFGVWLIYVADRLADTAAGRVDHETARHAFYQRNRRLMLPVAAATFLGLAWFAPAALPVRQFVAGLGLLTLAGGYFWLVHLRAAGQWARVLPKEAFVAGMFAVGTAFFVVGQTGASRAEWWMAYALFGGACFFNCALITKWERNPADRRDATSLLNAFPRLTTHLRAGCLVLAVLAVAAALGPWRGGMFAPVGLSALLLALLDWRSPRCSIEMLRVLADAALLTPWLCWSFPLHP